MDIIDRLCPKGCSPLFRVISQSWRFIFRLFWCSVRPPASGWHGGRWLLWVASLIWLLVMSSEIPWLWIRLPISPKIGVLAEVLLRRGKPISDRCLSWWEHTPPLSVCWLFSHIQLFVCDPLDCSPPGSSVHGFLLARLLDWVAISFSRGSSQPRTRTQGSCTAGRFFTIWATREALSSSKWLYVFLSQHTVTEEVNIGPLRLRLRGRVMVYARHGGPGLFRLFNLWIVTSLHIVDVLGNND